MEISIISIYIWECGDLITNIPLDGNQMIGRMYHRGQNYSLSDNNRTQHSQSVSKILWMNYLPPDIHFLAYKKVIHAVSIISLHWDCTRCWNPYTWKTMAQLSWRWNIMASDNLRSRGISRDSVDLIFLNIPVSAKKGLILHIILLYLFQ